MEFTKEKPTTLRPGPRSSIWTGVAAELKAHPGEWGKVKDASDLKNRDAGYTLCMRIRKGDIIAFQPGGTFEAITDVDGHVWAQYRTD